VRHYSAFGLTVAAAFPGNPTHVPNPPALQGLFPGHTGVTSWSLGDLGSYKVGSYELAFVEYANGFPASSITSQLEGYDGGLANTTMYGRPALKEVSPTKNGRWGGSLAFSKGNVLVLALGYDSLKVPISHYIGSVRVVG
jgi:hypothetical protein